MICNYKGCSKSLAHFQVLSKRKQLSICSSCVLKVGVMIDKTRPRTAIQLKKITKIQGFENDMQRDHLQAF